MKLFGQRPGSRVDKNGDSSFPRRDGTTTIVPKEYWPSIKNVDPIALFNTLANLASITLLRATHDEVIGQGDFSKLNPVVTIIDLEANHDFTGPARVRLIKAVRAILV
jgi:hypothetical protein